MNYSVHKNAVNYVKIGIIFLFLINFLPPVEDSFAYNDSSMALQDYIWYLDLFAPIKKIMILLMIFYTAFSIFLRPNFFASLVSTQSIWVKIFFLLIFFGSVRAAIGGVDISDLAILTIFPVSSIIFVHSYKSSYDIVLDFFICLLICLIVSYFCVYFFPEVGVHNIPPGTVLNEELYGAWKGIFWHKNIAGGVFSVLFCISFVLFKFSSGNISVIYFLTCLFSMIFIFFTKSSTAIVMTFLSIVVAKMLLFFYKNEKRNYLIYVIQVLFMLFPFIIVVLPEHFEFDISGRRYIWDFAISSLNDFDWIVGKGYGGVFNQIITTSSSEWWMEHIGHGHSGVIEAMTQFGLPGVFIYSFVMFDCIKILILMINNNLCFQYQKIALLVTLVALISVGIRACVEPDLNNPRPNYYIFVFLCCIVLRERSVRGWAVSNLKCNTPDAPVR